MKIKNKKTGKIIDSKELLTDKFMIDLFSKDFDYFKSKLDKIQEEWKVVPEKPKEYWFITCCGDVDKETDDGLDVDNACKEIGNYFETQEEAEKAIEKLKAWKRLKENGFKIKGWKFTPDMKQIEGNYVKIEAEIPQILINEKDIDLLFGGEE